MKECENCSKPMIKDSDFGDNNPKNVLCKFCFMDKGNLVKRTSGRNTENEKTLPSISDLDDIDL